MTTFSYFGNTNNRVYFGNGKKVHILNDPYSTICGLVVGDLDNPTNYYSLTPHKTTCERCLAYSGQLPELKEKYLEGSRKGGLTAAKNFTAEHQRNAQAGRSSKSLSEAGKKGYKAAVKNGHQHTAARAAAQYRLDNPSNLEQTMMNWFEELELDYVREVELMHDDTLTLYFIDFVVNGIAIEVNGNIWHKNSETFGDLGTNTGMKYRVISDAGYLLLVIPEQKLLNEAGKQWVVKHLKRLFDKVGK